MENSDQNPSSLDSDNTYYVQGSLPATEDRQHNREAAVIMVVASIGMVANFCLIMLVLLLHSLRRASNAFLFHHCFLDFVKGAFCLIFAQSVASEEPPMYCSVLGGSYVVFVTSSSFNMLAMVMNEAYQFTDLMLGYKDSRNYCCVIFGVFIIWFSSIIMNLGVNFIPRNPGFDRKSGLCIFIYGVTRHYVLHVLWILLISLAIGLTVAYLHKLHMDIKRASYYRLTTLIRATVSINPRITTASQRKRNESKERHHLKHVQRFTRRKLYLLILLTILFVAFWYPLFVLTMFDYRFKVPRSIYKALNMFAWSNPTINPLVLMFVIKSNCCCQEGVNLERDLREESNERGGETRLEHPDVSYRQEYSLQEESNPLQEESFPVTSATSASATSASAAAAAEDVTEMSQENRTKSVSWM